MQSARSIPFSCLLIALTPWSSSAIAQDFNPEIEEEMHENADPSSPSDLRELIPEAQLLSIIENLHTYDWARRENLTRYISSPNEGFDLSMIAPFLLRSELPVETQLRIKRAARALLSAQDKAGLGVGFGATSIGGVQIGSVVDDIERFPAAAILKPGDLIISADGIPMNTSDDLRVQILSHTPDEELAVVIDRDGEILQRNLPLGSFTQLVGAAVIEPHIADRVIAIRLARQGIDVFQNTRAGDSLSINNWVDAGYPEPGFPFRASNARRTPLVTPSGSSREIYVGIGTLNRNRIEPWSNKSSARHSMLQSRQITLSRDLNEARIRLGHYQDLMDELNERVNENPNAKGLKQEYSDVQRLLRSSTRTHDLLEAEFKAVTELLEGTP